MNSFATTPGEQTEAIGCADGVIAAPAGPATCDSSPREFRTLPPWALAAGGPGAIDARLDDDAVWIPRRYRLRVRAAREGGHHTHGDGTALDLIPVNGTPKRSGTTPPVPSPMTRLDPSLRALRNAAGMSARPGDPVHRL